MTDNKPNVIVILADDMGYSDIGCFGSEIPTPNLDSLAAQGVKLTQFYNTARCSPSRASLLTGLHPHQTGIGILTQDDRPAGYAGTLTNSCVTIAEVLRAGGYGTYMSGKWHLSGHTKAIDETWPTGRGFDRFFGSCNGGGGYYWPSTLALDEQFLAYEEHGKSFFYTDKITEHAVRFIDSHLQQRGDDPFFCYVAYTAPHWPLHASPEDINEQRGRYDAGWDKTREARWRRQQSLDLFRGSLRLSDRDASVPAWEDSSDRAWQAQRMEVYAAQITRLDKGVGQILDKLDAAGITNDTLVIFLSDNGGCAEEIPAGLTKLPFPKQTPAGAPIKIGNVASVAPGPEDTFMSYGRAWANVSNTPFREYKHWVHEGGIATPLLARWKGGNLRAGESIDTPFQLPDIMATVLDATGVRYPSQRKGQDIPLLEGTSMLKTWQPGEAANTDRYLYWEHEGNAACRRGRWKLVKKYPGAWELYDLDIDRSELNNLALEHRDIVLELSRAYEQWAIRVGVIPREVWAPLYKTHL